MPVHSEMVTIEVGDGTTMGAFAARPEGGGPFPGLLVFQEIFGVNAHIREVATRFAAQGFATLAPDLFHRSSPGFECSYEDRQAAFAQAQAMAVEGTEADLRAAFQWLQSQDFVRPDWLASVGFCMGGRVSFLANAILPLQAAISFYGGGIAQNLLGRASELHAPMLFFWGGKDEHIGPDDVRAVTDALREQGKPFVNVEFSEADHGFFCNFRSSYHPAAAGQAWTLAKEFLAERLK